MGRRCPRRPGRVGSLVVEISGMKGAWESALPRGCQTAVSRVTDVTEPGVRHGHTRAMAGTRVDPATSKLVTNGPYDPWRGRASLSLEDEMTDDMTSGSDQSEALDLPPSPPDEGRFPIRPLIIGLIAVAAAVAFIVAVVKMGDDGDEAGSDVDVTDDTPAADEPSAEPTDDPVTASDSDDSRGEGGDDPVDSATADLPAADSSYYGGGEWLVPWGDGFLDIGIIFHPAPLPELDGEFSEVFPPEVRETIESVGEGRARKRAAAPGSPPPGGFDLILIYTKVELRFGAQKTGGPTHLINHALETMFRLLGLCLATNEPR